MQSISRGESFGAKLGSGLGELAGYKIGQLLKKHQQEQERSQFTKTWEPILGKHSANFLSNLAPEERKNAMQDIGSLLQLNEAPSSQEQARGMQSLGMAPQQQMPDQQQNFLQGIQNRFTNQTVGQRPQEQEGSLLSGLMGAPQQYQQQQQPQEQAQQQQQQLTPERAKLIENLFKTPQQRAAEKKLEFQEKELKSKEDLAAWANTKEYREEILNTEQSSREALQYIKEAQRLEKKGDFPSQAFASFLKGAEWEDVPGFLSGDAEAFNKVLANFQRGVKDVYGGNVSNLEMQQFLKTIPTIYHTPEGRSLIFAGMKKYYRGGKERAKVEREVIKENGGVPPQDLHEQVNEKFKPIQKELSRSFKRDVEAAEKLASKTSRLESVAAYGAGKTAGAIPGILKGGAKGAIAGGLAGSVIPGIGTGLGALGGGALGALGGSGGGISDLLKLLL